MQGDKMEGTRLCEAVERLCDELSQLHRPQMPMDQVETVLLKIERPEYYRAASCQFCCGADYTEERFTITSLTGRSVQTQINFCPVCGRYMKR